jgi:hypothetical protein
MMARSRRADRTVVAAFFAMIMLGLLGGTVLTVNDTFENRPLADWPEPGLAPLLSGTLLPGYTSWLRDRHGLRERSIIARNWIKLKVFGDRPADGLSFGVGGWLFMKGAAFANCSRKATAAEFADRLGGYLASLPAAQKQSVVLLPDKEFLQFENVREEPFWLTGLFRGSPAAGTATERWFACSNRRYNEDVTAAIARLGPTLIDVRAPLLNLKRRSKAPLYFKQDTHWTFETSAHAGAVIVAHLQPGLWRQQDLRATPGEVRVQDLSRLVGLPVPMTAMSMTSTRAGIEQTTADFSLQFSKRQPVRVFAHRAVDASAKLIPGSTVIVYDSFMIPNLGVITPYFEKVTWIFWDDFERPEAQGMIRAADRLILASVYRLAPERVATMGKLAKAREQATGNRQQ